MAEIFPDEGLNALLAIFPKNGANLASLWLGFFTSQTASTVPGASAVLSTLTGVTEATGTGYARTQILAAAWGANAAGTPDGRKTTASATATPAVGAGGWGTLNGFFLASASTVGTAIYYSNFASGLAIPTSVGDVITVTPYIEFGA